MKPYGILAVAATAIFLAWSVAAAPITGPVSGSTASQLHLAQAAGKQTSVRVKSAVLREGPSTKSKKVTSLPRGTKVQVLEQSGDWTKVRAGAREGYVSSTLLNQ